MEYDLNSLTVSLLIIAGVAAGFINTIAGGGAMFTLPALMLLGMPADLANGTNRLAVVVQSATAVHGFSKHDKLETDEVAPMLTPTLLGALIGAVGISYLPAQIVKPILLGSMMLIALVLVFAPSAVTPPMGGKPLTLSEKPSGNVWMFFVGLYGGAIQGGVGFILLAVLVGVLRYDLVRGNAQKMVCACAFGLLSLVVFSLRGQVHWIPGVILALATIVGVHFSVRFAISVELKILKRILLATVMLACGAAFLKG